MIDNQYNVWLIEANSNPCIEESSQFLKALIPRMIDDAFKLTIDKLFPKPYTCKSIFLVKILRRGTEYTFQGARLY